MSQMSEASQKVPIEHVNWVRRDGSELVVSLVTMGRSLAFSFSPDAARALLDGVVKVAREQADDAIPVPPASRFPPDAPRTAGPPDPSCGVLGSLSRRGIETGS
ncbi:hypothetical protein MMR14E_10770 [Methylobacterium mesophilicum]